MKKHIPILNSIPSRILFFGMALLFGSTDSFGQQGGITKIYTDFNGYWASAAGAINPVKPDNSHNLLGFTWNGATYSTGVNDASLTAHGVAFIPKNFQAFPIRDIKLAGTAALPAFGQLKDGVNNGRSVPPPFTIPADISAFLTDGIRGLDLGTGVANVPTGTLIFDFGGIIAPSQIGDGIPDILVSQIADPSAVLDSVYFTDGAGNLVGNRLAINHTTLASVGTWTADFYNVNGTLNAGYTNTDRSLRIWAADISAFGITSANYSPALSLRYKLNGTSDPAFLAFNTDVIQVVSANDDMVNTAINTPAAIDVLANDQPAAALNTASLQITSDAAHGALSVNPTTGVVTYTPATGYSGTDHFTYQVCNGNNVTPQCDDAIVTINVGTADLSVTKTVDNSNPPLASKVVFTITANNQGVNDDYGVKATDLLPDGYTYLSASATVGSYNQSTGVWTVGNLASGANAVLTVTALVNASGNYTNTAAISGGLFDPATDDNTATVTTVPVAASSDLQIVKTVDNQTAAAGTNVVFTLTATNNGQSNATGVTVQDVLPSGFTFVSGTAPPGSTYNAASGIWNIGSLATGSSLILTITATVKASGSYVASASINGTNADPAAGNNQASVTITPSVGIPVFVLGAGSGRCQGTGSVTYAATATNAGNLNYALSPASAGSINTATGAVSWDAAFSGTATITASASGTNGPATAGHTITVNPLPEATIVYSGSPYCATGTAPVTLTGTGGGLFHAAAGLDIDASTGIINTANSLADSYTVDYSFQQGGCSNVVQAVVAISKPTITVTDPLPVCAPSTIDLTDPSVTTGSSGGLAFAYYTDPSGTATVPNPTAIAAGNTYYIKGINTITGCSSNLDPVTVKINDRPAITANSSSTDICKGSPVTLTASSPGNDIEWVQVATGNPVTVNPAATTTYTAIATNSEGCSNTATATVQVKKFTVQLTTAAGAVLAGNTVTLNSNANFPYEIVRWMPQNLFPDQSAASQSITIYDTSGTFSIIAKSNEGCLDTADITLSVNTNTGDFFIPNAFTPNNDGRNDVFSIYGSSIREMHLLVFDQWGKLIFETRDGRKGWDGNYGGHPQPTGVYVYAVKVVFYNNTVYTRKGTVNLIR